MKKKWIIGICIGVILCCFLGIAVIGIAFSPKVYEGNHLKFEYDKSLKLTSREQKNGNNITAVNEDGTVEVSSIILQLDDMDEETFFEYFEDDFANSKEFEVLAYEKRTANDGEGTEYYKEYEILGIDNDRYRALAQLQILDDDYYLYTLAYIQEDFDINKKLAGEIVDSIVYSEVEDVGDLELTSAISALFEIDRFLISNVDNYVEEHDMYTEDLVKEHEEYMESIPADLTLKDVEGYEYLMQVDIASADGNIYPVMVPKEYDAEGEKRFITYLDNGFMLSMYAREFFDEETLVDFLEVCNDFIYEDPERDFINVEKTDIIEENGIVYQICTAQAVYGDKIVPQAELVAAIPLDGEDVLAFSLTLESDDVNKDTIKYLEELEEYYGVPVTQFEEFF